MCSGAFELRDKDRHDGQVQEVMEDPELGRKYGVKKECPLTPKLEHFHVVKGYPPDLMHDIGHSPHRVVLVPFRSDFQGIF